MGADDGAGFLRQSVRPDGHQRVEPKQRRCRAQDGQVRPLPLRLDAQMLSYFLERVGDILPINITLQK